MRAQTAMLIARLRRQRGSALTELAIISPLLVLVLLWSIAFTDMWVVKLKAQEATRFALWHIAAMQSPGDAQSEVARRYAKLHGDERPDGTNTHVGTGLMTFPGTSGKNVTIASTASVVATQLVNAHYQPPPGTGWFGRLLSVVQRFLGNAAAALLQPALRAFRFNLNGTAQTQVTLTAQQALFHTSGKPLFGVDFTPVAQLADFKAPGGQQQLTFDTWKAWPSPYHGQWDGKWQKPQVSDISLSPTNGYEAVERNVAGQIGSGLPAMTYGGLQNVPLLGTLNSILQRVVCGPLNIPCLMNGSTQRDPEKGPIAINPVTQLREGRYTVPYLLKSQYFNAEPGPNNGYSPSKSNVPGYNKNAYSDTYACRGNYYEGSRGPEAKDQGGNAYGSSKWSGCR